MGQQITQEIDWAATREKFAELPKKYTQHRVALSIGVGRAHFCQIMNANYPFPESARSKAVIAKLAELGVLVYQPCEECQKVAGGAQ